MDKTCETCRWQPIDIVTPVKWHKFIGRRIGLTTLGFAVAFSTNALFFGVELIAGSSRGIAISIGPVWLGIAVLRREDQPHTPKDRP